MRALTPLICPGFTLSIIAGVNSSISFPGSQVTFYAGAAPVALITSTGAMTAASYAAGSSSYGGTSASVNGSVTATSYIAGTSTYGATSASVKGPISNAAGTIAATASPIGMKFTPASTGGFAFSNAAGTTTNLSMTDAGALTLTGATAYKSGGGLWTATSDERLKRNIAPHTDGLAVIRALRPIQFEYNGKGGIPDTGVRHVGLLAHEAQPVIPRAIGHLHAKLDPNDKHDTDLLTVDASELLYTLVNAVQALSAQVAALQAAAAPPAVTEGTRKRKVPSIRNGA